MTLLGAFVLLCSAGSGCDWLCVSAPGTDAKSPSADKPNAGGSKSDDAEPDGTEATPKLSRFTGLGLEVTLPETARLVGDGSEDQIKILGEIDVVIMPAADHFPSTLEKAEKFAVEVEKGSHLQGEELSDGYLVQFQSTTFDKLNYRVVVRRKIGDVDIYCTGDTAQPRALKDVIAVCKGLQTLGSAPGV